MCKYINRDSKPPQKLLHNFIWRRRYGAEWIDTSIALFPRAFRSSIICQKAAVLQDIKWPDHPIHGFTVTPVSWIHSVSFCLSKQNAVRGVLNKSPTKWNQTSTCLNRSVSKKKSKGHLIQHCHKLFHVICIYYLFLFMFILTCMLIWTGASLSWNKMQPVLSLKQFRTNGKMLSHGIVWCEIFPFHEPTAS